MAHKSLGRPTDQRLAIFKSLVAGVLQHGYVTTTEVRAKQVRPIIEQVITLSREDTVANRRLARRWIPIGKAITTVAQYENVHGEAPVLKQGTNKQGKPLSGPNRLKGADRRPSGEVLIKKLFEEIGPKYVDRPGGYLRLTKLGGISHMNAKDQLTIRPARRGDSASMVKIELVD